MANLLDSDKKILYIGIAIAFIAFIVLLVTPKKPFFADKTWIFVDFYNKTDDMKTYKQVFAESTYRFDFSYVGENKYKFEIANKVEEGTWKLEENEEKLSIVTGKGKRINILKIKKLLQLDYGKNIILVLKEKEKE